MPQNKKLAPARGIPDARRAVAGRRDDTRSVRAEVRISHRFGMPLEDRDLCAGVDFPDVSRAVDAACDQARTVPAERDRTDSGWMVEHGELATTR